MSHDHDHDPSGAHDGPARHDVSRRDAVRRIVSAGLSFSVVPALVACASSGSRSRDVARMPEPEWPTPRRALRLEPDAAGAYTPAPPVRSTPVAPTRALAGVRTRAEWTSASPVPSLMDRMLPVERITLHHDGMTPFTSTSASAAGARIEAIRTAHRGRGWGDIGYHYVLDPAGRVWEGRPLSWQGAHVGGLNHGNIGVCVLGNYEEQRPRMRQLDELERFLSTLMRRHRVPLREVYTHRELAPTACPGRYLQPRLVAMRDTRGALARA